MDYKGFKKVGSDHKSTTFKHKNGSWLKVAHRGLSKSYVEELKNLPEHPAPDLKSLSHAAPMYAQPSESDVRNGRVVPENMAYGGDVAPQDSDVFMNNRRALNRAYVGKRSPEFMPAQQDDGGDRFTGDEEEALNRGESVNSGNPPVSQEKVEETDIKNNYAEGGEVDDERAASASKLGVSKYLPAIDAAPNPAEQSDNTTRGVIGPQSPLATPVGQDYVPAGPGAPIKDAPAYAIPSASAADPFAEANKTALRGLQKQQQGAQQMAVAQGELGAREASANSMAANAQNSNMSHFQAAYQKLEQDRQAQMQDINQGHIDPNHYINSMTTGGKIRTAIGLILGGIGGGMTHQPNMAAEYINKQISNDIDSQKADLANKHNLLSANFKATGNLLTAAETTRMQVLDLNSMHLKTLAAGAQNDLQRAALLGTAGKLDQEAAQIQSQIAMRNVLVGSSQGGDTEQQFQKRNNLLRVMGQDKFADAAEERHAPGVGNASRKVPESALSEISARNSLDASLADLENFSAQNSGSLNPSVIKQGKAKAALVGNSIRTAEDMGVIKKTEAEFMQSLIADPTQFFAKYRASKAYQEVRRDNTVKLNSLKSVYGLPVTQQEQGAGQGTPKVQTRPDGTYQKVPGGWKRIK